MPIPSTVLGSFPEKLPSCRERRGLEPRWDLVIERTLAAYPEAGPGRRTLNSDWWLSFSKVWSESLRRFWSLTLLLGQKGKDVSLSPVSRLLSKSPCLCEPREQEHLGTPLPVWPGSLIKHSEYPLGVGHRARTWGHNVTSRSDTGAGRRRAFWRPGCRDEMAPTATLCRTLAFIREEGLGSLANVKYYVFRKVQNLR